MAESSSMQLLLCSAEAAEGSCRDQGRDRQLLILLLPKGASKVRKQSGCSGDQIRSSESLHVYRAEAVAGMKKYALLRNVPKHVKSSLLVFGIAKLKAVFSSVCICCF